MTMMTGSISRLLVAGLFVATCALAADEPLHVVDAEVDLEYHHNFMPLDEAHDSRVLIDRFHKTIYTTDEGETGAEIMLDIMNRDGFAVTYADSALDAPSLEKADVLIIHGLPNNEVALENGGVFWQSPLSNDEIDAIVRWVDAGGGLYLSLSHFPNGSGALPLLEAFAVKFRDGYLYSKEYPSFTDAKNGRCSHYFGMSRNDGTLNGQHPIVKYGLPVETVDYLCGAAIFRAQEDAVLPFPKGSENHLDGRFDPDTSVFETSDAYAGMIGFDFGKGKVVVAADQGMFRDFVFTFNNGERVYVTITSPDNDNANLFVNMMRWLSPKISVP
jgi:putative intracellular protease/amidase